ncbi:MULTISPECIES: BppU family phage baseplate upper protein [Bacillus]|nr:BppU family phage baseplate upper protein [Bacillus sp. GeD10]HEF1857083.1 BppU family phage baseplate upper protein [Bacillus cereus]CCW06140.1 Phage protein [Bacillus sp. GeD10]HEF1869411.1 BppU family phage baseplate upper protein [Bacillus cereus]HEF1879975.1 BppU family phage baseplate upper protein [Bacillus cereus]HEF1886058.1 BppU family phage baseplate upper protein [Bacillus cereus]
MRNEEIIIDLADPVFNKTIRSRQNDKNGLKITVYVREKGQIVDLTGYAVKYEAINQVGLFVRDDAQIVDAKNGVFSYTLSSQAVSTSDDWTAYFVMEKSTERMSTPDIRITLRRDVKEGNIKIENYISEFEIIKKTLDELQKKLNAMDVVKKSGDTMIGDLNLHVGLALKRITSKDSTKDLISLAFGSNGSFWIEDRQNNNLNVLHYDNTNKKLNVNIDTNLMKKSNDSFTGLTRFTQNAQLMMAQSDENTGASARGLHYMDKDTDVIVNRGGMGRFKGAKNGEEYLYMGFGATPWDSQSGLIVRPDGSATLKGKKIATAENDTGWIKLPTTGVENVANRDMKYKRSGENISVIGSVRNPQNEATFATLPVGFRPVQHIAFPALAYGYTPAVCEVTIKPDGGVFVNGVPSGSTVHIAMNFLI